jgi:hypothetical protein
VDSISKFTRFLFSGVLLVVAAACQQQVLPTVMPTATVAKTISDAPKIANKPASASVTVTATATANATPVNPQGPIFGAEMESIATGGGLEMMTATNMAWVRKNAVIWSDIEPNDPGVGTPIYLWSAPSMASLETELKNAANNGMRVVLVVRSTPEWARKIAGTGPSCGPIAQDKLTAFGDFMNALVRRYSVAPYNVNYWEMWNEEDAPPFDASASDNLFGCWGDSKDAYFGGGYYAEMLKTAYPQIKAADAQAQVLIGGLLLDCDPRGSPSICSIVHPNDPGVAVRSNFLEGILKNGGGAYFDGISFHAYDVYLGLLGQYYNPNWASSWNTTGPVSLAKAQFIKGVLSANSVTGKYLMNTESAMICGDGTQPICNDLNANTTKAYYVAQAYAAAIALDLRANIWYSTLGWRASQLLSGDLSPTPAYIAFKFAQSELRNTANYGEISPSDIGGMTGLKGYKFQRGDRQIWVIWSEDGSAHTVNFSGTPLAAWDTLGNSVTAASPMEITINPYYLEWTH